MIPFESFGLNEELGMKVAASPQIYILQRSCHHNPELITLNLPSLQNLFTNSYLFQGDKHAYLPYII